MPTETSGSALSDRDAEILKALVQNIRVLSVSQLARTWWKDSPDPESSAWKRAIQLRSSGFAEAFEGFAHPELSLPGPVRYYLEIWPPTAFRWSSFLPP